MLVQLDRYEAINTDHMVSAKIDACGDTCLVLEMVTGHTIRVKHTAHCLDGVDVYAAYRRIVEATES